MCKRITEAHGGTIVAQSTEGVGSRFTVILPINHNSDALDREHDAFVEYVMPEGHILPSTL